MKQFCKQAIVTFLTAQARRTIRRHQPVIIAVTGSVGKTSTKDLIFTVLRDHTWVRKSSKSFNSEIGVPLSVLGLPNADKNPLGWLRNIIDAFTTAWFSRSYPNVLVLEAGVDRPGDMHRLTSWLRPDIVVLTRLPEVPVHVEYFQTPEAVVAEKMQLAHALSSNGLLINNHDDPLQQKHCSDIRQRQLGFSRYLESDMQISADTTVYRDGLPAALGFTLTSQGESVSMRLPGILGVQYAYAAAAAALVGREFDMTLTDIQSALDTYTPTPGRMRLLPGVKHTVLIDDTYNSSPIAAESSLTTLREVTGMKRKIAVLGDMLELGNYSSAEHERIGGIAAKSADVLLTIGVRSRKTAEAALAHGMSEKVVFQYDEAARAGRELQQMLEPGDIVLVKGSQGVRAETVVQAVMANPDHAAELLVRQDWTPLS